MDAKIVNNKEEFEEFFYYDKTQIRKKDYPQKYPCICRQEWEDGGIGGGYVRHIIVYCPDDCMEYSFFKGVEEGWNTL